MDYSLPGSSIHAISQQKYWNGLPFSSSEDLPNLGVEPTSPALQVDSLSLSHLRIPTYVCMYIHAYITTHTHTDLPFNVSLRPL